MPSELCYKRYISGHILVSKDVSISYHWLAPNAGFRIRKESVLIELLDPDEDQDPYSDYRYVSRC
jgi:hypothetical protein